MLSRILSKILYKQLNMNFLFFFMILTTNLYTLCTVNALNCYKCGFDYSGGEKEITADKELTDDQEMTDEGCKMDPPGLEFVKECGSEYSACFNTTLLSPEGTIQTIIRGCSEIRDSPYGCQSEIETSLSNSTTCICITEICNGIMPDGYVVSERGSSRTGNQLNEEDKKSGSWRLVGIPGFVHFASSSAILIDLKY